MIKRSIEDIDFQLPQADNSRVYHRHNCTKFESIKPENPRCLPIRCVHCNRIDLRWYCPVNPNHVCVYTESYDSCDFCGEPEERK